MQTLPNKPICSLSTKRGLSMAACNGMNPPGKRGALIVLEGCDRSGKSTQCRLLVDKLKSSGTPAELMVFPDRTTPIGSVISDYLKKLVQLPDQAVHLLFTANRWEKAEEIKSLVHKGVTVIVDRYSYSGVAYSAAKNTDGLTFEWCKGAENGLPKPDAVLYLNLKPESIAQRKGFGGERYELPQFQKGVAECYEKLRDKSWTVVDADKSIEDLTSELFALVEDILDKAVETPLETLW